MVICAAVSLLLTPQLATAAPPADNVKPPMRPARLKGTNAQTLETRNKTLATAKLRVQTYPTLENQRALAEEYMKERVLDLALDHFEAALRLDPHDVPSLDGSARIWREWGYANVALPPAYRALYWAPDSPEVHNTLGTVLLKLGLVDSAREHFERARSLAPGASYAVNNLCYLELQHQDAAAAVTLCREAAAMDPESPVTRNNLAMALAVSGDVDAAVNTFGKDSSPAVAAYNQGMMLLASGQRDRAQEAFTRARTADPAFYPALTRLKQLAAQAGN